MGFEHESWDWVFGVAGYEGIFHWWGGKERLKSLPLPIFNVFVFLPFSPNYMKDLCCRVIQLKRWRGMKTMEQDLNI